MFIGSLKKSIFSFLRSKFDLYQGNSAFYASFFCAPLPKIVCNFLIIRGTIRKKTPLSHARPAATVVAPPLPRPPGSGANMPPALRPPVWDRSQGAQKDVRELSVITGSPGSSLSSHHSTEGCQEPDRRNQGAQKDVRELSVITGSPGSSLSSHHSTEGCQEPDRRNQGAQKDVRGSQRAPYIIIYTLYGLRNITVL